MKAFRIFTQHQTPPKVLPPDIREALGPLADKKNVYYADLPPDVMGEMWHRFRLVLVPHFSASPLSRWMLPIRLIWLKGCVVPKKS